MKRGLTLLLLLWFAGTAAAASTAAAKDFCSQLWKDVKLREIEQPIWAVPSIPSQGVLPNIRMFALVYAEGQGFVPRDVRESNCFLDRILDDPTRNAILDGTRRSAGQGSKLNVVERIEALFAAISSNLDKEAEGESGQSMLPVLANLEALYGLRPGPVADPGPFLRHAYSTGLYTKYTIEWYILVNYAEHLGARSFNVDKFLKDLRAQDAQYAPPSQGPVAGCQGGIEYTWPHIGLPPPDRSDVGEMESVHFGICRSSQVVWSYHYRRGWHALSEAATRYFCDRWRSDPEFTSVCSVKAPN